jgi:hypothetical protein
VNPARQNVNRAGEDRHYPRGSIAESPHLIARPPRYGTKIRGSEVSADSSFPSVFS